MSALQGACFLLTLGLILNLLGYVPGHLRLLLTYTLLLVPALLPRPEHRGRQAFALIGAALAGLLVRQNPVFEICALLAAHFCVWTGYRAGWRTPYPAVISYALLHIFLFLSPPGYHPLHAFAALLTGFYAKLMGAPCNLGYTYSGVGPMLMYLLLSAFRIRDAASLVRCLCFAVLLPLLSAASVKFGLFAADLNAELTLKLDTSAYLGYRGYAQFGSRLLMLAFPAVLFLAQTLLFLVFHRSAGGGEASAPPMSRGKRRSVWLCAAPAVLLMVSIMPFVSANRTVPRRALFYSRGVVSFSKPEYANYGTPSVGMYGTFVDFVGLLGFDAQVVDAIPPALDDVGLIVLTNLDQPLAPGAAERIWKFVSEGGALWVLGDHTFIKNGRNHVNDFLRPTCIRLVNDSAKNLVQGWFESYELRMSQPFASLRNDAENSLCILVGASLSLKPPAQPLILGRYGFSDLGPRISDEKSGNLGDFKHTRNEQFGDLVLVAGQPYGKGRVIVFGDTTSFFNANTGKTHALIRSVLTWLRAEVPGRARSLAAAWAPYPILVVLLACVLRAAPSRAIPAILGTLAVYSLVWQSRACLIPFDGAAASKRLAIIDHSHVPRVSKHALMPDAAFGLSVNVMRCGWLPVEPPGWDRALLANARCLFLLAPRKAFSRSEIRDVLGFMDRGGTVVMTCGRKEYAGARGILDAMGLGVRNLPLGRFFDRKALGTPVSFFSAWPLTVPAGAEIIAAWDDWPLIVSVPRGKGAFVLVGDSEFLLNKNLEGENNHDPNNIEFLRRLFARLGAGEGA